MSEKDTRAQQSREQYEKLLAEKSAEVSRHQESAKLAQSFSNSLSERLAEEQTSWKSERDNLVQSLMKEKKRVQLKEAEVASLTEEVRQFKSQLNNVYGSTVQPAVLGDKEQMQQALNAAMQSADIQFEAFKAQLKPSGEIAVQNIANMLDEYRGCDSTFLIEAHTECGGGKGCPIGLDCQNVELTTQRVEKVLATLRALGCQSNLSGKGWGCKHPTVGPVRIVRISVE